MWLIKASLKNPYMVATLVFMILVLGVLAVIAIPKDILPVFKAPAVQILTYYQGMPAESVEKTITNRIERWVNQAPGAAKVESKSVVGGSVVRVYFRDDIDPNSALTLTNALAQGTLPTLPPNTLPPVTLPFDPTGTMPLGVLTVKNPHMDEAKVKDLARIDVRNMLGAVPGCVAPVVVGGKDRTVLVYLRPKDLQARHLSALDVVAALRQGNLMISPGTAYFGPMQVLLDSNSMVKKVEDLNDFPIRIKPGDAVYLRDVGEAKDAYAIQTSRVRIDGSAQVYVPIYRQQGASSLSVATGVKDYIHYMESRLPEGTKLDFVMDQSLYVKEAISSLIEEGIMGACLVSVMILIFLGNWRMTVIASMSIPLAILGAIVCLHVTGNTINAMTLGGLALAIGPLVDDAIVELENNHRNYHLGKSRIRAALDGCAEVMVPVLVATCTTNIVLAPIALMPGMGGFLFRPLALAVTFAMVTSFLLSRTFVPMMCAKFLPDVHGRGKPGHAGHAGHADDPDLEPAGSALRFQLGVVLGNLGGIAAGAFLGHLLESQDITNWGIVAGSLLGSLAPLFVLWRSGRLVPRLIFVLANVLITAAKARVVTNLMSDAPLDFWAQQLAPALKWAALGGLLAGAAVWVGRLIVGRSHRTEHHINTATRFYERLLALALRRRLLVLGAVLGLFVAALMLTFGIGREFFPQVDAGQITIYLRAPSDTRLDAAEQRVAAVERFIAKHIPTGERDVIVSELGLDPDWSVAYTANSGQQDAIIRVQLNEKRTASAQEYAIRLRHLFAEEPRFADLRFSFDTGGMVSTALNLGASSPIDLQVEGGKGQQPFELAKAIRNRIHDVPGAADVRLQQRLDAPYKIIDVDRKKAADMGLPADDVLLQVVAAMNSSVSINRNFWIDTDTNNQYFVAVQYPEDPNRTLDDVLNVPATGGKQDAGVTLRTLVTIRDDTGAVEVNHFSLYRTFDILVNTEGRDIGGVAADINRRLLGLQVPDWYILGDKSLTALRERKVPESVLIKLKTFKDQGFDSRDGFLSEVGTALDAGERARFLEVIANEARVAGGAITAGKKGGDYEVPGNMHLHMRGEYEQMNRSFRDLALGLALAALLVYLLQVALFRSWVGPFIIMLTVPLGLIGVLTMLFVTRTTLNVQSAMGVIFLVGIAVNNGVLLVDFANKQRKVGAPIAKAITTAAAIRFRPIVMTFLATFLDLIPMAFPGLFGTRGGESNIPLARAVVGGLLTSTCLTLFVVPIMYTLLMRDPLPPELDLEAELADAPPVAEPSCDGVAVPV
ncbi:MAG TPA: efflux RND transporter permease subunit [Gemmataceae bacterium]|nr:efflux RND transporter permease subunit [Gemmataceae bacterium]